MNNNRRDYNLPGNFHRAINVAEKPSVAKNVSNILNAQNNGNNSYEYVRSLSKFNPVFKFDYTLESGLTYEMYFTSVAGHIMNYAFGSEHKKWDINRISELYDANILHQLTPNFEDAKNNIENIIKQYHCDTLILWLDCDREGENIAFEIIEIAQKVNPNLNLLRARFSAITSGDLKRTMNDLDRPNKNLSNGVEIRQKIDLIIGASFTRLQTLSFKNIFFPIDNPISSDFKKSVISYGPCQFPTMNFVIERAEKIINFIPQKFYYISLILSKKDNEGKEINCKFNWDRERLFDPYSTLIIYEYMLKSKYATITQIQTQPQTRRRPIPLNTVNMIKLISQKLRINSKLAMDIAEKLYRDGLISYPRTETQKYKSTELNGLKKTIEKFSDTNTYGNYCRKLSDEGFKRFNNPRAGKEDDQSHPPIHPVGASDGAELNNNEKRVQDL